MSAESRNLDPNLRRARGSLLLAIGICSALSLFSYDWRDISLLKVPPNDPACNLFGLVGAWVSFLLFTLFGLGAYFVSVLLVVFGLLLILSRDARVWSRAAWAAVLVVATASIVELDRVAWITPCQRLNIAPDAGGLVGRVLMRHWLVRWLSPVGAGMLMWAALLVAFVMLVEMDNLGRGWLRLAGFFGQAAARMRAFVEAHQDRRRVIEKEQRRLTRQMQAEQRRTKVPDVESPAEMPVTEPEPAETLVNQRVPQPPPPPPPKVSPPKKPVAPSPPDAAAARAPSEKSTTYRLPTVDLFAPVPPAKDREMKADTVTTSKILVETLNDFGIQAEVMNVERGPVVTRYELLPAPGIRVERIASLSNNLALSLKATSVRVQAPVPGKGVVGIEVPNSTANMVYLRELLQGETWRAGRARLPLALGKDVAGCDLIADLTEMPHLLIAGATGSGKTVCMNAILTGLLMARTPEEMRLLLVDPKIVEFAPYNNLPHLVVPVITNPKKVALGLRWAINEMEKRYKLFAKVGVRNIEGYNSRPVARQSDLFASLAESSPETTSEPPARLPYIVIVIDELADLMLADQAEIENCIARLAQLSRAVGIHMILSTQRPSVNVITGTIKANFPSRIAFQVAQKVDSRTILDTIGAEKLLGRGDMLFLPPGSSKPIRAQGAFVTDNDIRAVTEAIRSQAPPAYEVEIHEKLEKPELGKTDDNVDEELVQQALVIIRETRRASTSSLQRRLRIGYTRAARIMDILEERGILGPPRGAEPREILVDLDGEIPNNQLAQPEEDC